MDRALLLAHREDIRRRIAEGEVLIAQQKEFVSHSRSAGLLTGRADTLLRLLEAMQASHMDCLADIEREPAVPPVGAPADMPPGDPRRT